MRATCGDARPLGDAQCWVLLADLPSPKKNRRELIHFVIHYYVLNKIVSGIAAKARSGGSGARERSERQRENVRRRTGTVVKIGVAQFLCTGVRVVMRNAVFCPSGLGAG